MVPPAASCLDRDALGERRQMRSGLFLENESKRERNHKCIPCLRVNRSLPGVPQDRLSCGVRCVMARYT